MNNFEELIEYINSVSDSIKRNALDVKAMMEQLEFLKVKLHHEDVHKLNMHNRKRSKSKWRNKQ